MSGAIVQDRARAIEARGAGKHHAKRLSDGTIASRDQPVLDWLDRRLIDAYQRDFPVCEKPFAEIASHLHCQANEVLRRFAALGRRGVVSRIGPVFAPNRIGASTLAAMAVPRVRLESVAEWLNWYPTVHDICEREHEFNLWFALAAPNAGALYEALAEIRHRTGLDVLDLRLERDYRIDPAIPPWPPTVSARCRTAPRVRSPGRSPPLDAADLRLAGAIQDGLPLTVRPYALAADRAGLSEAQAMERLRRMLREGVIERIGVVVRHCEVGYRANALVVFDVPRARVDTVGERLAHLAPFHVCCRRIRRSPAWPFNLHCTLHGRDRSEVMGWVDDLLPDAVGRLDCTVLFRRRRFRPGAARFASEPAASQSERPAPWPNPGP